MGTERAIATLIDRIDEAGGPDREIDAMIWAEIDGRDVYEEAGRIMGRSRTAPHDACFLGYVDPGKRKRNFYTAGQIPPIPEYTAKIDDALTLIPKDLFFLLGHGRVKSGELLAGVHILRPVSGDVVAEAEADTLPVAICIAALQARAEVCDGQ